MALLLRMGGVPARVATGFTPGVARRAAATTWSATTTRTRGSRCGSRGTAGSRSTRRRPRRPARSRPTPPSTRRAGAPRRRADLGGAGAGDHPRPRPPAEPGHAVGTDRRSASVLLLARARAARSSPAAAAAAPGRGGVEELERALALRAPAAGPGRDAARARGRARGRPAGAGLRARAARAALRRRPAARRPRAARRCAGSWPGASASPAGSGRWWALPPPPVRRAATYNEGDMDDVYDLYKRGAALLEAATTTPPPCRWPGRRARARQDLDPRGPRPRVVPRAAATRRPRGVRGRRRAGADERLRALLPRALAADARAPPGGPHPLALAAGLRPDREDYRAYRDRAAKAA